MGKYSTKFHKGRLRPEVQPFTLLPIFDKKRDPFRIPLIDKWYPFYIPVQKAASFLTAVNVPPLSYEQVAKPDSFLVFFTAIKCAQDRNDRFPEPFMYFNKSNPYPLIYLKPEKGTSLWRSLPIQAILASALGYQCY